MNLCSRCHIVIRNIRWVTTESITLGIVRAAHYHSADDWGRSARARAPLPFLLESPMWSRPHCARWGPSSPPPNRGQSPQFSAHFHCGQTAGWIKSPPGTEVDLGPGHTVLDGVPDPRERGTAAPSFRLMSTVATVAHLSYCWARHYYTRTLTFKKDRVQAYNVRLRQLTSDLILAFDHLLASHHFWLGHDTWPRHS